MVLNHGGILTRSFSYSFWLSGPLKNTTAGTVTITVVPSCVRTPEVNRRALAIFVAVPFHHHHRLFFPSQPQTRPPLYLSVCDICRLPRHDPWLQTYGRRNGKQLRSTAYPTQTKNTTQKSLLGRRACQPLFSNMP